MPPPRPSRPLATPTETVAPRGRRSSAQPRHRVAAAPEESGEAEEAEGPAPVADHNFPDLNTVNVADGSTVNLAAQELAGGDTPVLLWFYAPH